MICTNCGAELKPGAKFCGNCGTPVTPGQEEIRDSNQNIKSVKSKYPSDWSNNQSDWSKEQDDKTRFDSNKNVNQSTNQTSHNILISRFFARILDSSLLTAAYFIYWVIDLERRSYFYVNPNIDINTVLNGLKVGFWGILKFHSQKIFFMTIVGIFILHFFVEPLLISIFGTTPGKAMYGIKVRNSDNSKLNIMTSYKRSFRIYWQGMLLGLPLLSLIANIFNFVYFKSNSITRWDKRYQIIVFSEISSLRRYITHAGVILFLVIVYDVFF